MKGALGRFFEAVPIRGMYIPRYQALVLAHANFSEAELGMYDVIEQTR
jgi:hypothetical protein